MAKDLDGAATKAGQVYTAVKKEILSGQLKPGAVLDEANLAKTFEVSRTPVRDALRGLAGDGLLVAGARRQMLVVDVSQDHRDEITLLRIALEGAASVVACERRSPEDLDALRLIMIKQRRFAEAGDSETFMALDEELHKALADVAQLPKLSQFLDQLGAFVRLTRIDHPTSVPHMLALIDEHEELLTYLEAGDAERLRDALADHIRSTAVRA